MAENVESPRGSFAGWDWKKFVWSLEKPLLAVIVALFADLQGAAPAWAGLIGALGAGAYAALKFWIGEYAAPQ